jgi:hypothetical protein
LVVSCFFASAFVQLISKSAQTEEQEAVRGNNGDRNAQGSAGESHEVRDAVGVILVSSIVSKHGV